MRDWLFLLAPPALIFYFIAYPDSFYAFVSWARHLDLVSERERTAQRRCDYSNETPTFLPSVQMTLQCLVSISPSTVNRKTFGNPKVVPT